MRFLIGSVVFLLLQSTSWLVSEARAAPTAIGQIKALSGGASVLHQGSRHACKVGEFLEVGDVIETGADGMVNVTFTDSSQTSIGPNSQFLVEEYAFDSSTLKGNYLGHVRRGLCSFVSGEIARHNTGAMSVKTPRVLLGVRGTTFLVKVTEEQ